MDRDRERTTANLTSWSNKKCDLFWSRVLAAVFVHQLFQPICCGRCARRRVETESCEFHPVRNRWRSAWLYADVPLEFAVMYCTLSDRPFLSPSRPGFYFRMLFNRPIFPERLLEVRLSKRTACGFCWCDIFTRRMPFLSPNQKYQNTEGDGIVAK